ncbi:unnamed protein product [Natator depressus]
MSPVALWPGRGGQAPNVAGLGVGVNLFLSGVCWAHKDSLLPQGGVWFLAEGDTVWEPCGCDGVSAMGRGKEKSDMKMASKMRPGAFCGRRHAGQCQGLGRQPGHGQEKCALIPTGLVSRACTI